MSSPRCIFYTFCTVSMVCGCSFPWRKFGVLLLAPPYSGLHQDKPETLSIPRLKVGTRNTVAGWRIGRRTRVVMWSGTPRPVSLGCVVRVTSRANKASFHEKSASEPAIFCASVLAPRPWEWEKGPLAHSLLAGVQQQQPNQPSRSARFHRHRLLSSFLPAATPGGNGRFRLQRERPGGRGGVRLFVPPCSWKGRGGPASSRSSSATSRAAS